jgi:hypothetical protein
VFAGVSAVYVSVRIALFGGVFGRLPPPYGLDRSTPLVALKDFAGNLAQYLLDLALCIRIEPAYLPQFWFNHPLLFAAAVTIAVLLLAWVVVAGRSATCLAGLAWLALFTAPSLLSMPGERNIYLGSVGLALLIGAAYRSFDLRPGWRWLGRASYTVLALWLMVGIVQQTVMGCVAGSAEKVYCDLRRLVPDPPPNAKIYVINQNPVNSVGFTQAIRLRYDRPDLSGCALSLSPTLTTSSVDRLIVIAPDTVRIVREGGCFFTSFVERFHRFGDPPSSLADSCRRHGIELCGPPPSYDRLTELRFRFACPLSDPGIILMQWDNQRIRGSLDILRLGSLAELKPCELIEEHLSVNTPAVAEQ